MVTELHGYIIQMLWNFYSNDQKHLPLQQQQQIETNFSNDIEDDFDIFEHFQSNPKWNDFMQIIEHEMRSRIPQQQQLGNESTLTLDSPSSFNMNQLQTGDQSVHNKTVRLSDSDSSDYSSSDDDDYGNNYYGDGDDDDEAKLNDPDDLITNDNLNWNPFRKAIENGLMPNIEYLSHFSVLRVTIKFVYGIGTK